jgi:hypothetical protein
MIRDWTLAPLGVLLVCLAWIWLANRRPRRTGVSWPAGFDVSGPSVCPDLVYAGDVVLGCEGRFESIQCRSLTIAAGGRVRATRIVAQRVTVLGDARLRCDETLTAAKRLEVRGELSATEVQAKRIVLGARSLSTVLTAAGSPRIKRHPGAIVKGFFADADEARRAGAGSAARRAPPPTATVVSVAAGDIDKKIERTVRSPEPEHDQTVRSQREDDTDPGPVPNGH